MASDPRILGASAFITELLTQADRRETETLRLARKRVELPAVLCHIVRETRVREADLRGGIRRPAVVRARQLFSQVAVRKLGHSGAAVARFLGVTTSSVNRLAASEELPECTWYVNAL